MKSLSGEFQKQTVNKACIFKTSAIPQSRRDPNIWVACIINTI